MKRSLVSIEKGSVIPLIKNKIWFIANGVIRVWSKSTYRDCLFCDEKASHKVAGVFSWEPENLLAMQGGSMSYLLSKHSNPLYLR